MLIRWLWLVVVGIGAGLHFYGMLDGYRDYREVKATGRLLGQAAVHQNLLLSIAWGRTRGEAMRFLVKAIFFGVGLVSFSVEPSPAPRTKRERCIAATVGQALVLAAVLLDCQSVADWQDRNRQRDLIAMEEAEHR